MSVPGVSGDGSPSDLCGCVPRGSQDEPSLGEPVRSLLEGASPAVLRSLGIPTTGAEWSDVGTLAGIGSLAAMLVGALLGGMLGARWHTKLTRRAASPNYGPDRDQPTTDDRAATTPPRRSRRPGPGRPGPVGWWRGDPDRPGPPTALTADLPQHRRSTRQSSPAAWATVSEFRVGRWPACWRSKVAPAQAG